MTEREALLARRMRELQLELDARRRDLARPSGALHLSRDLGALDPQTARDFRPDALSRSTPNAGAMSARSVVTRDAFGHRSWDDRDAVCDSRGPRHEACSHMEFQEIPPARPLDEARAMRMTYSDVGSFAHDPKRPASSSPRCPASAAYGAHELPLRTEERDERRGRRLAAEGAPRHESVGGSAEPRPPGAARGVATERRPAVSDALGPEPSRNDVGFGEPSLPKRRSMPSTIGEGPRDAQGHWTPEQDSGEDDTTAQWMAGLRTSKEDESRLRFDDPLVFGAGFKPPKRSFSPNPSESSGPWMASFHMGGRPLPSRRSAPDSKSVAKPEVKFEAKPEPKLEQKPQHRPEAKPHANLGSQHRDRKPAVPQTRPQATPQPPLQATAQPSGSQVPPPQAAAQSGSRARAQSCPRAGTQSKPQARAQSPRASPQAGASPLGPRGCGGRSPRARDEHGPRGAEGAFGGASPPPHAGKAPGRAPSPPPPPGPSPQPASGAAPPGSSRRSNAGKPRQVPRAKAESGGAKPQPATEGAKEGRRQSMPGKLLDALKAEMMRLRRVKSSDDRKKHFLKLCFQWHPDKNPANVQLATKGFQMLQEQKARLLAG